MVQKEWAESFRVTNPQPVGPLQERGSRMEEEDGFPDFFERILAADEELLTSLYRRYTPRLRSLVARVVGNDPVLSDDLVQETWTFALNGLGSFRGEASFGSWLMRICRNRSYTYLRRERSRREREGRYAGRSMVLPANYVDAILLDRMLWSLNDLQRKVIVAFVFEGYNQREIAASLNIPEGTSRSALSRARHQMRQSLK